MKRMNRPTRANARRKVALRQVITSLRYADMMLKRTGDTWWAERKQRFEQIQATLESRIT